MVIGLTGGIACGKSTVRKHLGTLGCPTLDADQIVRDLYRDDAGLRKALANRYGDNILLPDGIDRKALARRIFGDPEERGWLEGQVHPRVREVWEGASAKHREELRAGTLQGNARFLVVEIPLLFEKSLENHFHVTLSTVCSVEVQRTRLEARGLTREEAYSRISNQLSLDEKASRADFVVTSDGSFTFTEAQITRFLKEAEARI